MSKFIPVQTFNQLYSSFSELLTDSGIKNFIIKLDGPEGKDIANQLQIEEKDLFTFRESMSDPQNILFHGWVEENGSLQNLLVEGRLKKYDDSSNHLKHQFLEKYQVFLSPYLSNNLLQYKGEEDLTILENAFSYVCLLDKNHRPTIESQLFEVIKNNVSNSVNSCKIIKEESELIELVKPLCDDRIISCVNSLSRASYAYKLGYIDEVLKVLKYKSCTPRFANWILKKLGAVQLNNEHEYKVKGLRKDLKEGDLAVRNHGKGGAPIKWGNIITLMLTFIVGGLVFWVVKYKPFSDVNDPQFTNDTSFMQFSKEERKKIDSLLVSMKGNLNNEDLMIDQGIPLIGESDQLTLRKTFLNASMERVYQDFIKDAEIREGKIPDSCQGNMSFEPIIGSKVLSSNSGKVEAMIKNESGYDAIIVVAEDNKGGNLYSMLLKQGETKSFKMNYYNHLMVIPGNDFQAYSIPKGISVDELPSDKFKHYFCNVDFNYLQAINTTYQLTGMQNGKAKFLLMGDKGLNFHLIDINGVLEDV